MNHEFRNELSNALVASMPTEGHVALRQLELREELKIPVTVGAPLSEEPSSTLPRQSTVAIASGLAGMGRGAMIEQTLQNLALSLGLAPLNMNTAERDPEHTDLSYFTVQNEERTYAGEEYVQNKVSLLGKAGASVLIVEHNAHNPCPAGLETLVREKTLGAHFLKSTFVLISATLSPTQSLADGGFSETVLRHSLLLPPVMDPSVTDLLAQRRQDQAKALVGTSLEDQTPVQLPPSALTQRR